MANQGDGTNGDGTQLTVEAPQSEEFWQRFFGIFGKVQSTVSRVSESLDYEPVQNELYFRRVRKNKAQRHAFG